VDATNNDGNTPLLVAAFMCRTEIVKLLLKKGASTGLKNKRGEIPVGVVSGTWTKELGDFYTKISTDAGFKVDLKRLERERPQMAKLLGEHAAKSKPDKKNAKSTDK
jgi:hypothetical protein